MKNLVCPTSVADLEKLKTLISDAITNAASVMLELGKKLNADFIFCT
jgi:hypothetical protein